MTQLTALLDNYRSLFKTERAKDTYLELFTQCYRKTEHGYADIDSDVWMYVDWAKGEDQKIHTHRSSRRQAAHCAVQVVCRRLSAAKSRERQLFISIGPIGQW